MRVLAFFRSVRARLGLLIVLAMVALVGYLVYDGIQERSDEETRARESLVRLATFAAAAERTRFNATANFFEIVAQAQVLTTMAATPNDQEAYDACTRGLYISDQLVPGTRFTLWDINGKVLCSSRAAKTGAYNAAGRSWFEQAKQRQGFATGEYERHDDTDEPGLSFGVPIHDATTNQIVAYLSASVVISEIELLPTGENLPETGRLSVVDQHGIIVHSTGREPGYQLPLFPDSFLALGSYLDSAVEQGNGRTGAAVRITDSNDAYVAVIVSAETNTLVTPLAETLFKLLAPVALLTLITLVAVWLLGERWIVRPIESLGAASDALAMGEFKTRADAHTGVSELDRLAARFNEMAIARGRANQAKDEFLGLVSHELKTPITMTLGNAEVLRNRGGQLAEEVRQAAIDDIYDSAERLAAIVDNLLVLARLERGNELEIEPLRLLSMAQNAANQQQRRLPERQVTVRGDATALALGGETYVDQVLQNLIGNALKYSPKDQPVEVSIEEDQGGVVVRVLDRGPGIDESELESVFQPFYRSERTATTAEGIGIGLSVCRRLVEAMGGSIWATPRAGGGTEFGVRLRGIVEDDVLVPDDTLSVVATSPIE